MIDVGCYAALHREFVNLVGHRRAGYSCNGLFFLHQATIAAHRPELFHMVRDRMNKHGAIELTATTSDVHATFNLQGLTLRHFGVLKLIGMRRSCRSSCAAAHFDVDAHSGVRRSEEHTSELQSRLHL